MPAPAPALRFAAVLGNDRGSGRLDSVAPTVLEQLRWPWLDDAAIKSLCVRAHTGPLEDVAAVVSTHYRLLNGVGERERNDVAGLVLDLILDCLCCEARARWSQNAYSLWSFCGHKKDVKHQLAVGEAPAGFTSSQHLALGSAICVAAAYSIEQCNRPPAFDATKLQDLAARSYVRAVCDYTGARMRGSLETIAGVANHRRGALKRWQREYDRYQAACSPPTSREFAQALGTLSASALSKAMVMALQSRPLTPEHALDDVRGRRDIYEQCIINELRHDVALRCPRWD